MAMALLTNDELTQRVLALELALEQKASAQQLGDLKTQVDEIVATRFEAIDEEGKASKAAHVEVLGSRADSRMCSRIRASASTRRSGISWHWRQTSARSARF